MFLGLAVSPDAKRIASIGIDHTVRVWDVSTGKESIVCRAR